MKYKYKCTTPMLPPGAESSVMDDKQMEDWLNAMDEDGWRFVSYAQKKWLSGYIQNWWIFRQKEKGVGEMEHTDIIPIVSGLLNNLKTVTEQLRRINVVIDAENPPLSQAMLDALHGIDFNISEAEEALANAEETP